MVYIPPPHVANGTKPSYAETYQKIISTFRLSPLTSASSVIILVALDVDALCAARMLSDLFNQDDVIHRIIPVSGFSELEDMRAELSKYVELHTLILLNIGGLLELSSDEWFGSFGNQLTVHVIDSLRPLNLESLFVGGSHGERIIIWDDGGIESLQEERKSWEALAYEPAFDSDDEDLWLDSDDDDLGHVESADDDDDDDDEYDEDKRTSGKRRSLGEGGNGSKRRRTLPEGVQRMKREERKRHEARINKYYTAGTHHAQSAASTIYVLATVLERVDNDLLWFAILGLTYQYTHSRISREKYENYHSIYHDEVHRLNALPQSNTNGSFLSLSPDDNGLRATDELRFMHFRHWTLYDAMYHSSYVASKLGIWKERGRRRLTGLLAKMGFSIPQTQQPYSHMDIDLKRDLLQKLSEVAPEYGLVEMLYPSFTRCYGYRSQPLSAADAIESIGALLDVASGVAIEIQEEGARNGGEWFSGIRIWEVSANRDTMRKRGLVDREARTSSSETSDRRFLDDTGDQVVDPPRWWVKNFWTAFDALDQVDSLRQALDLSMSLHRAVIRQGTSIIDKQDIRTMRNHRVVVLSQGPDLALFSHPSVLSRLALWLVNALRDRLPDTNTAARNAKRKNLPFVVACLNESADTYMVVGITGALDFGDVRKNEFGLAFLQAKEKCNVVTRHTSLDASVLEIEQRSLKNFLSALCED